jgi:transposase
VLRTRRTNSDPKGDHGDRQNLACTCSTSEAGGLAFCGFCGHREKVVHEAGGGVWRGDIWPGVQVEAVRLVGERGVSVSRATRDLEIHENMLRRWAKELTADPAQAFPGHGQSKPEQLEIERLRREVAKPRAERDSPQRRRQPSSREKRDEVRFHREAPERLAGVVALRSAGRIAVRLSRLAASRAERPGAIRRATDGEGSDELCRQRPRLWRAPGLARCPGRGRGMRPPQDRAADARQRLRARPASPWLAEGRGQRSPVVAPNVLDRQFAAERPN